ncbi:MAG: hypothetical protein KBA75_00575 [Alphaproteobacteria bacterium]|nr:hypothetical protein [Alphaproteobacteria bacterium]
MVRKAGKDLKKGVVRLFGAAKKILAERKAAKALERIDPHAQEFVKLPVARSEVPSIYGQPAAKPTDAEVAAADHLQNTVAYAAGRAMVTIPRETRLNL